ncbi:MAG TPA: GYD domain-containing protein [Nitrososphaera sp.]
MPSYIILNKLTDQGAKNVKDSPKRARAAQKEAEKLGGKLTTYYTFGEYITVNILEAPSDEAALSFVSQLVSLGNVQTTTLKAFTVEEAAKSISSKPS